MVTWARYPVIWWAPLRLSSAGSDPHVRSRCMLYCLSVRFAAIASFLLALGFQVSGYTNVPLAIGLWSASGIFFVLWTKAHWGTPRARLSSLENSRKMKEKSHRASQRCYRCGVETRLHAHARRLDGYSLYSASHVRIRAKSEAGGHGLRHG